ncbi:unnamed protein product, partial [marine sediment metagenome]
VVMNLTNVYTIGGLCFAVVVSLLVYAGSLWVIKREFVRWCLRYCMQTIK